MGEKDAVRHGGGGIAEGGCCRKIPQRCPSQYNPARGCDSAGDLEDRGWGRCTTKEAPRAGQCPLMQLRDEEREAVWGWGPVVLNSPQEPR